MVTAGHARARPRACTRARAAARACMHVVYYYCTTVLGTMRAVPDSLGPSGPCVLALFRPRCGNPRERLATRRARDCWRGPFEPCKQSIMCTTSGSVFGTSTPYCVSRNLLSTAGIARCCAVAACRRGLQRGWSLSSFSTGVSPRRAPWRRAHIQTAPSLSHPEALSFVSAAEDGRRLEMDLKLRGAGDSTRSSGSG